MALDLSTTSTGVAMGCPATPALRTLTIKPHTEAKASAHERIVSVTEQVVNLYRDLQSATNSSPYVVIEELASIRNGKTTKMLARLHGAVEYALKRCGAPAVMWVHQATAKARLGLPPTRSDKAAVMKRVKALGYRPSNFDEADAVAVYLSHASARVL